MPNVHIFDKKLHRLLINFTGKAATSCNSYTENAVYCCGKLWT